MLDCTLNQAIFRLLRPIVRLALKNGGSAEQFCEASRRAFVEVADQDFKIPGKKQSAARISVLTGINRRAVAKIQAEVRDAQRKVDGAAKHLNRAERVISCWLREPEFRDVSGEPISLPLAGEVSFDSLIRRNGVDLPARAVADELLRVGAIVCVEEGRFRPSERGFVPDGTSDDALHLFGEHGAEFLDTIEKNIEQSADRREPRLYQRRTVCEHIPVESAIEFQKYSAEAAQKLLEEFDAWLEAHQATASNPSETVRMGFGMFHIHSKNQLGSHQ